MIDREDFQIVGLAVLALAFGFAVYEPPPEPPQFVTGGIDTLPEVPSEAWPNVQIHQLESVNYIANNYLVNEATTCFADAGDWSEIATTVTTTATSGYTSIADSAVTCWYYDEPSTWTTTVNW